jgi:hypothetical protein
VHAQDVTLRLQGPPELGGSRLERAGHDDHLDFGIGKQVFNVVDLAKL